jgi:hypothetical protein
VHPLHPFRRRDQTLAASGRNLNLRRETVFGSGQPLPPSGRARPFFCRVLSCPRPADLPSPAFLFSRGGSAPPCSSGPVRDESLRQTVIIDRAPAESDPSASGGDGRVP